MKRGFTLIELLVVVAIISLLSSVVFASVNTARSRARDARRLADLRQLQLALELYYDTNGEYPTTWPGGCTPGATLPNSNWCNSSESFANGHWISDDGVAGALAPFLPADPLDPLHASVPAWLPVGGYTYFYFSGLYGCPGQWYMIVFGLENTPHAMEAQDGVTGCDGTLFHYGSGSDGIITVGRVN